MLLELKLNQPWRDIVIFSDPHYNHKNLVKGVTSWSNLDGCRDFDSLEQHNQTLVSQIQKVCKNKITFCLGDWSFGGRKFIKIFREQLQPQELHFIAGNHDHHIIRSKHNEHDLFDSVSMRGEIWVNGQFIVMQHRAERIWDKAHKKSWMLYGHSHGRLETQKPYHNLKTMDVGIDTHPKFRPYTGEEIHEIMKQKEPFNLTL